MGAYSKKTFWMGVAERATKTFAQTAAAAISTAVLMGDVNWAAVGSMAALAALYSVLTSMGDPKATDIAVAQG